MKSTRRFSVLVLVASVMSSLVAVATSPAGAVASTTPTYHHKPITVSSSHGAVVSGLDGSVTIGCGTSDGGSDLVTYSKGGDLVRQLDHTEQIDGVSNCIDMPQIDKMGVLYGIPYGKDAAGNYVQGKFLYAYDGNDLRWKYPAFCGTDMSSSVAIGGNGNIYVTTRESDGVHLIGLTPNVQIPTLEPAKVLDIRIQQCGDQLYAYKDGIVVMGQRSGVNYYSYGGKYLGSAPKGDFWHTKVGADGTLFTQQGNLVRAFDPLTGMIAWTKVLAPNTTPGSLYPTSNGGVVAYVSGPHMTQPGIPAIPLVMVGKLLMFNASGKLIGKEIELPNEKAQGSSYGETQLIADVRGNLVITRILNIKTTVDRPLSVPAIEVTMRNVATGKVVDQKLITGDSLPSGQPNGVLLSGLSVITSDTVALIVHCTTCEDHLKPKLIGLKVMGLTADYPRAAVLVAGTGKQPTPVAYVALGDSYSSGEGVLPFYEGTDVKGGNQCHRSEKAYATIVGRNRSPWIAADLSMGRFVACSGAETDDVRKRSHYGEDPQYLSLNDRTKLVTVTIGGNDIGFADFGKACIVGRCSVGSRSYSSAVAKINTILPDNLAFTYGKILRYAPNARVYVLGYPQVAPVKTPKSLFDPRCGYLYDGGSAWADARGARKVVRLLNLKIGETVAAVSKLKPSNHRLQYVEVNGKNSPFAGHTVCAALGLSYFNNLDEWVGHPAYTIHPNKRGQEAYAILAMRAMAS